MTIGSQRKVYEDNKKNPVVADLIASDVAKPKDHEESADGGVTTRQMLPGEPVAEVNTSVTPTTEKPQSHREELMQDLREKDVARSSLSKDKGGMSV